MPNRLRRLKITRADLVDRGANYDPTSGEGSHVLLFKREAAPDPPPASDDPAGDPTGGLPEELIEKRIARRGGKYVVLSESGKVLGTHDTRAKAVQQLRAVEASKRRRGAKKAVEDALAKIFGWPDDDGDPIDKADEPAPPTFTEALMREKMDEVMEDLSDHVWALRSTLYGVLASAATNKSALVTEALDQFKSSAGGCVSRWLEGSPVDKAGRKISSERMGRLKEMYETLGRLISEAEDGPTAKRENDSMPTQEEFDAIMKRLESVEAKAGEADTLKQQLEETNTKLATAEEKVAKAEQDAQAEKDLRETQEAIAVAKRLGLNPDDDAPVIKTLKAVSPESWAWVDKQLTALKTQVKKGALFASAGRDGGREPTSNAVEEAYQLADELVAKDAKLSRDDALAQVFREHPELYRKYHREARVSDKDQDDE